MPPRFPSVLTIARWEVVRTLSGAKKEVLPVAAVLFVLLVAATGLAADRGVHLQDGIYRAGVANPDFAPVLAADERFVVTCADSAALFAARDQFDLLILGSSVGAASTGKGKAALAALRQDYARYEAWVYRNQDDLFAAYPLWIDEEPVKSELDFTATADGRVTYAPPAPGAPPEPDLPAARVTAPSPTLAVSAAELREELEAGADLDAQLSRYSSAVSGTGGESRFKTPAQLAPPLPFDSIVLIFVFIFPLYFTSQFFMMSIMQERIGRRGEALLSAPVHPAAIITGKALPYLAVMIAVSAALTLANGAPLVILLPLIPVILFFLANALAIGMVARSFKELSFISIFFSTLATSYLFFPSIFANVHVVSLVSPVTLIVLELQGDGFSAADYFYSTGLFWITSAVLFALAVANYNEEQLFSQARPTTRIREAVGALIRPAHPFASLAAIAALTIPFVFMAQLMLLVLVFNLPMPASLLLLLFAAAFVEELAKGIGIYALYVRSPGSFGAGTLVLAAAAVAAGFLVGEKALLFATLAQISESIFGSVLFTSLQALWLPLLLHFTGALVTGAVLKAGGRRMLFPGLVLATLVHALYNLAFILGWWP